MNRERESFHGMDMYRPILLILVSVLIEKGVTGKLKGPSFTENYKINWGHDHVFSSSEGRDIRLSLDERSGSGIESKVTYGSGFFHLNVRLPGGNASGVVTAFYLVTQTGNRHDELDFEFLGNNDGKPRIVQTNVITNGQGDREQRIHLWFDPTRRHHSYRILWNHHQVVFFVDKKPIRVFKNKENIGVSYPSRPLKLVASIWNGDSWATDGGQTKINWTYAPFIAGFRSFSIYGCPSRGSSIKPCYSTKFWWNREKRWALSSTEEKDYQLVKRKYMIYDYCNDWPRFSVHPPECPQY